MISNRHRLPASPAAETALACVEAGIEAAHPRRVVGEELSLDGETLRVADATYDLTEYDELLVFGGGKAAGQVAVALEALLGDRIDGGVVVTDDEVETARVRVLRGDHPVPSERGVAGAREVLALAESAGERTLVLAAITGGGSALLPAPATDIPLADLRAVTTGLLESGAPIRAINAVRKHLSALKGGQLARAAAPATVGSLLFSDVVGDDPAVIASGPTAPDDSTFADALAALDEYDADVPERVRDRLARGAAGDRPETPDAADPVFERVRNHVLADGFTALDAARTVARERGYDPLVLSSRVRGEAREAAKTHVAVAEECLATGEPVSPPAVVLSGGETTVTVRGDGRGGPNQEFALSAAMELESEGVAVASVDTDGIDGATDVAGALVTRSTVDAPNEASAALADNDAYAFLDARDALVETGRTGTNVNDLRVVVVEKC